MLLIILTFFIISLAVNLSRNKTILYTRSLVISLINCVFIAETSASFFSLDTGVTLFGGIFYISSINHSFNTFVILICFVIGIITSLFPIETYYINKGNQNFRFFYYFILGKYKISNTMHEQYKILEYTLILLFTMIGGIFLMSANDLISLFIIISFIVAFFWMVIFYIFYINVSKLGLKEKIWNFFSLQNILKIFTIYVIYLLTRLFILITFNVNVFLDYTNYISIGYFLVMATVVSFIYNNSFSKNKKFNKPKLSHIFWLFVTSFVFRWFFNDIIMDIDFFRDIFVFINLYISNTIFNNLNSLLYLIRKFLIDLSMENKMVIGYHDLTNKGNITCNIKPKNLKLSGTSFMDSSRGGQNQTGQGGQGQMGQVGRQSRQLPPLLEERLHILPPLERRLVPFQELSQARAPAPALAPAPAPAPVPPTSATTSTANPFAMTQNNSLNQINVTYHIGDPLGHGTRGYINPQTGHPYPDGCQPYASFIANALEDIKERKIVAGYSPYFLRRVNQGDLDSNALKFYEQFYKYNMEYSRRTGLRNTHNARTLLNSCK